VALLAALLLVVVEFVLLRGGTPPIRDEAGRVAPRSVAELRWLTLGGARQAVLIRGADSARPVVLFLHGGPGMPAMYLAHAFQRPAERDFVMVQWDRRGAGKSYGARFPAESLTVRRTLEDLFELTRWLRSRFHRDRIDLVAHSWGTYLGLAAVAAHPEWYRAYVGMGQMVPDSAAARALQRRLVSEEARWRGDEELLARLAAPGARVTETDLFETGGELHDATSYWTLLRTGLMAPEYTLRDVWSVRRGSQLLSARFARQVGPPLPPEGSRIPVPLFLFLGRYDTNTPSALAARYLDSLRAPLKEVVWFERSAHFPFFEEPTRFRSELVRADSLAGVYWSESGGEVEGG
jgi:pimeloyl-ACP methyl ester carboxylesterase